GFSAGSSLAAIAAADPAIRHQVAFLHWFGGYYSAADVVLAVAGHQAVIDGTTTPWTPSEHVVQHLDQALISTLSEPSDQEVLTREFLDHGEVNPQNLATLSPAGRQIQELLAAASFERARSALAAFPPSVLATLDQVSPNRYISDI